MSSTIIKSHDHTLKIDFSPIPFQEFQSIGDFYIFEATANSFSSDGGADIIRLTDFSDKIYLEKLLGNYNIAADENTIFIQNVPDGILPESELKSLFIRINGHTNTELTDKYFDIQLVSKSTSVINNSNFDYTYTIPEDFDTNIPFILSELILAESDLETENYDFNREYQWSQDGSSWTDYKPLDLLNTIEKDYDPDCVSTCPECEITPIDPDKIFFFRVLYTRTGLISTDILTIENICINGEYEIKIQRLGELATISNGEECVELIQTDIYKVFGLTGYIIDSIPIDIENIVNIKFQISQDNCRSWSKWCVLTQENIIKYRTDPLRFFHIKYSICLPKGYDETLGLIKIYDIILEGSFQNVTVNYANGGKLGLRPEVAGRDVQQGITLNNGGSNYCGTISGQSVASTPLGSNNGDMEISAADPNSLWNPYETSVATELYNNLSNIASSLFGFTITYFPVNPDGNGIDRVIHEYQLYNSDECGDVKVLVPDNQFPDNQIKFTAFNLELFETFEIHITKDAFKSIFGIERRPRKKDYLFFPDINRMFEIEHAQANKDFLNTSTYYRVTLKKYSKKSNVKMSEGVEKAVNVLTSNTDLDDLFGLEKAAENMITNKEQYQPLSDDRIRLDINSNVIIYEDNLYNASLIFSKTHYDFSGMTPGDNAITYTRADRNLEKGDNRAINLWFNLSSLTHDDGESHIFLNNYDSTNSLGYKTWFFDGKVLFMLNNKTYELPVLTIEKDIWYSLLVNINQCDETLDIYVHKRFTTVTNGVETDGTELASSRLDEQWHIQFDIDPVEFILAETINTTIEASNLRMTNIRLFNNKVEQKSFTKVLNQYIIKKSNHIIFADNANEKIITSNHS